MCHDYRPCRSAAVASETDRTKSQGRLEETQQGLLLKNTVHHSGNTCVHIKWGHANALCAPDGDARLRSSAVLFRVALSSWIHPSGKTRGLRACGSDCHPAWPPGFQREVG